MDPYEGGYTFESVKLFDPLNGEKFDGWVYICYTIDDFISPSQDYLV